MSGNRRPFHLLSGLIISLVMMMAVGMTAAAGEDKTSSQEYLDSLNVGVATLLAPDTNEEEGSEKTEDGKEPTGKEPTGKEPAEEESDLVMADVQNTLNVRAKADEESEKVGVLYKDCGGRILERKDGWTKLRSGDLVGKR